MLSYLLAFITFVCSHTQCDPTQIGYSQAALSYYIQQYANATVNESNKLLQQDKNEQPPQ